MNCCLVMPTGDSTQEPEQQVAILLPMKDVSCAYLLAILHT
jgi:hypothetical protein